MKKEVTKEMAFEKLAALCSRSEQCEFDLNRKMINWGLSSANRKEVLESLRNYHFVDDARFAKSFTNDKARFSSWGPNKIKIELIKRKITQSDIIKALNEVDKSVWKEGLLRCATSKSKHLDLTGEEAWESKQKLFRYLISRGFPSSAVSKVINFIKKKQEELQDD
ncbi:MAG: RecX family transcriptional regulator [Muribaculaceae bacterium]|nr:RecX family transcriptional regulator [Muribaculaceae bacterium]